MSAPIHATVLAAGLGRRLGGRAKAALEIDGVSLLERLVAALRAAGVAEVDVVVGGPHQAVLTALAARCDTGVIAHRLAAPDLIDSQRLALARHAAEAPGADLMLTVADLPWLTEADLSGLVTTWHQRPPGTEAMRPVVAGTVGHPLLLAAPLTVRLAATGAGVREGLAMLGTRAQSWLCAARGPVDDLDTPEHLAGLRQALAPARVDWPPGASDREADQCPIDELQQNRRSLQAEPQSLI
ncbi:MAG: NTP transferase domain-containing protein [Sphaerotilus natans subsp. sulfidivorans]|uniref:nucleotidyltransferase family protein n=1 Tax=Sphaerotilus sulfidivorans TaxID=639200 RepID=UPI002356DA5D|nr:NTP transferase domain-containing protein [Sphaerotilus sulfidivorans]MCK6404326.1 NTP transferase domain-containing protein [Sphaerotilus sulfidivorans]